MIRFLGRSQRYALVTAPKPLTFFWGILPPHLLAIQPNFYYATLDQVDPQLGQSWALYNQGQSISNWGTGLSGVDIHADGAWKSTTGSKKVRVAILDSGINRSHEDLQKNIATNPNEIEANQKDDDGNGWTDDEWGWNFVHQNNYPMDDNGHGSFCAGIIGADWENGKGSKGINQFVSLLSVKILDSLGLGSTATAIEGIDYAVRNGAQIINMSWGGVRFDPALYEVIRKATQKGILFVAAAGNSGVNNDDRENAIYPASFDLPGLIAVAAYDPRGERAAFSNYGKNRVHLGAPGIEIFGTELNGYGFRSGTSFAAPHVAGTAALLKALWPTMTGVELEERILRTASPLHPYELNYSKTGALIHAENALRGFSPEKPKPPGKWKKVSLHWETPHPYLANSELKIRIREPGATRVRVHFKKLELEKKHDVMTLRDLTGRKIIEYSGNEDELTSAEAIGDELQLEFISDYNRQAYGVDIDYYEAAFE
ncbi:MAG: subtilase [Proteobacteria bacterium]|nr:subtilase [Pseudomonadota bacterium]